MKVSGFSFVRDALRLGYPVEESIRSALPLCDEFIVAVGQGDDGTLERLQAMDEPKLRLIETCWNEQARQHGFVYGQQKMIAQYNCTGDWAFYLEADEVLHEAELEATHAAMRRYLEDREVEALVFDYHHFYGSPDHVMNTARVYRRAARIIRNDIRTIAPDGLYWAVIKDRTWYGSRNKRRNRYPLAAPTGTHIYHYGNCRHERYLKRKAEIVNQYWQDGGWDDHYGDVDADTVVPFHGDHPAIIRGWLAEHANPQLRLNPDHQLTRRERKHRFTRQLEQRLGLDLSRRHFKLIRK